MPELTVPRLAMTVNAANGRVTVTSTCFLVIRPEEEASMQALGSLEVRARLEARGDGAWMGRMVDLPVQVLRARLEAGVVDISQTATFPRRAVNEDFFGRDEFVVRVGVFDPTGRQLRQAMSFVQRFRL